LRIRLNEKDLCIADLISSRDLFQMKAALFEQDADFHQSRSKHVSARATELEHAVMRLFSEQNATQRASWSDKE
jgi:hypothetical protein